MHQINIFTTSLFFTDQKDPEFKKETIKTKTVDKKKFTNILKNFIVGLVKNYKVGFQDVFIDNIKYYEDLKNQTNLKIVTTNVLFQGLYMVDVDDDCGLIFFERDPGEFIYPHTDFIPKFNFIARENTVLCLPSNIDFKLKENNSDKKRQYIYFTLSV
tara:strand:- start:863 stop:1336 length:474 start_codon:yes stop_codon:yes gene_type:complete